MSHKDHDDDVVTNTSNNPHFADILQARLTRRKTMLGGMSAAIAATFGTLPLVGCDDDNNDSSTGPSLSMSFDSVPKGLEDLVRVPAGYSVAVLYAEGDPFDVAGAAWSDNGSETGESYQRRAGGHHDGMHYFGLAATGTALDLNSSTRGVLCMNHEAQNIFNIDLSKTPPFTTSVYIHANGCTVDIPTLTRTVPDEVVKEINNHGISVIEVKKNTAGKFELVRGSTLNRRITAATEMILSGPVAGNDAVKTKFSTNGTRTLGTVNNCANGYTPWGTYLTCEENWAGYFKRAAGDNAKRGAAKEAVSLARYGSPENARSRFLWDTAGDGDEFKRWDTSVTGASASEDFRNAINTYGWIVEIDPTNPTSVPKKRTALGRFAHEGCWPAKVTAGKPVVFYMGDDNRNDYIYKFVSTQNYNPADTGLAAGDKYMDSGKLYAAKFNADGAGQWLELTFGQNGITAANAAYAFADQADVLLNTRLAADAAGATKMDRPEWAAVNPVNGEVYLTLTNNRVNERPVASVDAANPRAYSDSRTDGGSNTAGNPNGHIIRWRETGDDPAATTFAWDIYLFGANSDADKANVNVSDLAESNDFSSPDGLWFARSSNASNGLLWIQTDDGAYTDKTNCMMLAAIPGAVGDGSTKSITSTIGDATKTVSTKVGKTATNATLRRFLVGPKQCEITGIDSTPDGKTLFVNIQHPGEEKIPNFSSPLTYGSRWPGNQFGITHPGNRPRSATIVITKDDGGVVGI